MTEREPKDNPRQVERMNAWLDEACPALAVDRADIAAVTSELLRLIGEVAHGPSRPAAPLTAFALGVAAGRSHEDIATSVAAGAARLRVLLAGHQAGDGE